MTEEDVFVPIALASEVALECDVLPSNPSPQITWRRDGIPVVLDARRRLLDGGHYFYVSRLEEADLMSTYRCEVTNALADRTIPAPTTYRLLDNLTRGELLEYKQIGNLRAFTVNSSIEFAYVGGFTNGGTVNGTTNRLTRDGTPVTSVGNIGLITDLSTPGTSNLEATVTFGGSALDKSGTLTVYQLPCITMSPPNNREIVVGEENLMYSCEFEGSPTPSIQWFFNGQPIAAESGVSVSDNTLMIAAPQVSNSGIYQCIVSNDFGDDQAAWLLEIRPSNQLRTCPGEQQSLLCSANYTLLEWNISIINQTLREARSVPYESQNPMITPIVINSTTFTFLRVSSQNALPLVSIMTIMNINSSLEGTMVSCTGINSSTVSSVVLMKVLHVIRDAPNPSEIAVRTDMIHFGNDNFTVTLEWRQFGGETYSVATIPDAEHIGFTTNSRAQLVMLYNTQYKVNVTAMPCGHRNFALYYAQCNSPLTDAVLTDTVMVISGTVPALQGQNITFSCFGNESWLALCNEYGRWDPDPTETCKRNPAVKQNQNTVTSIVVSSVIIFALSSILFFFIGCACGWFGHMRKTKGSDKNITSQAAPVYEDLQPSAFMPQDQEKNFELKENVAYGPV